MLRPVSFSELSASIDVSIVAHEVIPHGPRRGR